ncbi:hypothetical protein HDZ31DRAFT_34131 [Schizophyllum fasciatum]
MKFFVVSMAIALLLATLATAMPVAESRAPQAVQETNAQRLARGLPPLKPRTMGTPTEFRRQAPSAMRRQAPSAMRRSPGRAAYRSPRDRYAGVYANV